MEKGSLPVEYKGKSLSEINLDNDVMKYPEENNAGTLLLLNICDTIMKISHCYFQLAFQFYLSRPLRALIFYHQRIDF